MRAAALMLVITSLSQKMTPLVRVVLLMRRAGHLNNVFASGSVTVCHFACFPHIKSQLVTERQEEL